MTSSKLAGFYSASRILVDREYSSLSVCGSFAFIKTSIRSYIGGRLHVAPYFIGIVSVSHVTVWSLKFMIMLNSLEIFQLIVNSHIQFAN
jgi:hypothetical protein